MSEPAPPQRRRRGAQESLASIVLAAESLGAFLGGLVIFGLRAVPDGVAPWWGVVAGVVMAVLLILTGRLVRYQWGIVLGWVLQVIIALGGFLVPGLLLVALIFGGMYAYATIKGGALDRRNAAIAAQYSDES